MLHRDLTNKIIQCFYKVYNKLGYGFLEKVYENSLMIEIGKSDLECRNQVPIEVYYSSEKVGIYYADLLVGNLIIVEIKAAETICKEHEYQLINYLKATDIEVGLLLNFGKKPQFKRRIFSNN